LQVVSEVHEIGAKRTFALLSGCLVEVVKSHFAGWTELDLEILLVAVPLNLKA
jgi:hypothetical protein